MRVIIGGTAIAVREKIFAELCEINARHARAYLLVPEQFTMQTELALLKRLDAEVMMDIKVKSFGSLSREVLGRVGGIKIPYVNENGRRMLAQYLLGEHRTELAILRRGWNKSGVAEKLVETLGEFRSLGMTAKDVDELSESEEVPPLLAEKLSDMALLLAQYEALLGDKQLDNEARLALLAEKIRLADWLGGLCVYVDGFHSLSQPEMRVLQALEEKGARVAVSLELVPEVLGEAESPWRNHTAMRASLAFLGSLKKAGFVIQLEKAEAQPVLPEAAALLQGIFSYEPCEMPGDDGTVALWKAPDPEMEVTMLAGRVRQMVFEEGKRFRDFLVMTSAPQVYFPLIERIFKAYEIPAFIDERKDLRAHYLVRYLLGALDMVQYRFAYPVVFACLGTGLSGIAPEGVMALEYFARAKHLRGTMYFDARYFALPDETQTSRKTEGLRTRAPLAKAAHEQFTARFKPLYEDLMGASTVREFATVCYHFLTAPELLEAFHAHNEEKSQVQLEMDAQIMKALVALLDQLVTAIGDMEVDLEGFNRIFSEGIEEASMGILPPAQDEVQVAELGRGRIGRVKVLALVGASDAWLPSRAGARTVFIKEEKRWLEEAGVTLRYEDSRLLEDEALSLYEALAAPSEVLILSYPLSDGTGAAMGESVYVERAKRVLPDVEETSLLAAQDTLRPYLEWESLKNATDWLRRYAAQPTLAAENATHVRDVASILCYFKEARPELAPFLEEGLYYTNLRDKLTPEHAKNLYPAVKETRLSTSELENWQSCPYKHFMSYGIRPEEGLDYALANDELGTVLHGSLDRLTGDLRKNPEWLEWDDDKIIAQMDAYLQDEVARMLDSERRQVAQNVQTLSKVRWQSRKAGRFIIRQLRESAFVPRFNEVRFAEDAPILPPVYLDLDGQIMRIEGRIDRVDTWRFGDKLYARVIDYKSGFNSFDISRVWDGLDLQLLLYLRAVMNWRQKPLAAGVFYLSLKNPFADTASLNDEEIEACITKDLLLDGVFVDDPDVVAALDKAAQNGKSKVIRVRRGSENAMDAALLEKLIAHTVEAAERAVRAVMEGDIRVLPYEYGDMDACKYCDYKAICRFEDKRSGNHTRKLAKKDWKTVKEALAKEDER